MTVTTIRPDGSVSAYQREGFIRSDSATYSTARGSYVAGVVSNTGTTFTAGQRLNAGTYQVFIGYLAFDVSSLPDADVVSEATLEFTPSSVTTVSDIILIDKTGFGTVDSSDFVTGAAAAAATVLGTIVVATANTANTTYQIALNASGIAKVQAAVAANGYFECALVSQKYIDGTAPAADERYTLKSAEDATSANRPALIVTHAAASGFRPRISWL